MCRRDMVGFTLIELLAVIAIIGILTAIMVPGFLNLSRRQSQNTCINNLREIGMALRQYREDYYTYPEAPSPAYLRSGRPSFTAWKAEELPLSQAPVARAVDAATNKAVDYITLGGRDDLPYVYTLKITGGTPATFVWTADNLTWTGPVEITPDPGAPTKSEAIPLGTTGITVTFSLDKMQSGGEVKLWGTSQAENFGLAKLYYLYLHDRKDYLRGYRVFHCPAMKETEAVDRGATLRALGQVQPEAQEAKKFDPLWAGYNTYDVTYNYTQFDDEIRAFDLALSGPRSPATPNEPALTLFGKRQLENPNAPMDTPVTWCYAHRPSRRPEYTVPDPGKYELALPQSMSEGERAAAVREAEFKRREEMDIVLWLDGSVEMMRPYLLPSQPDANGTVRYYWVPPYLYSRGGHR